MSVCFSRFWMDHIQDGPFWVAYGRGGAKRPPLPKTCHIHPTMMKLGTLLSYQKLCKSRGTPL